MFGRHFVRAHSPTLFSTQSPQFHSGRIARIRLDIRCLDGSDLAYHLGKSERVARAFLPSFRPATIDVQLRGNRIAVSRCWNFKLTRYLLFRRTAV